MPLFSRLKVKSKLVILFALFGILPALAIAGVFASRLGDLEKPYGEAAASAARDIGLMVDHTLLGCYGDVQAFAMNGAAWDSANWRNPDPQHNPLIVAMNDYVSYYNIYNLVMLVDPQGRLLAVNTVDKDGNPLDTAKLYDQNFQNEPWFQAALNKRFLVGRNDLNGTAVSDVYQEKAVADVYHTDGMGLSFSAPVYDHNKRLVGVWVNMVGFDLVENIMIDFHKALIQQGMKDVEMMLLDKTGVILMQYNPGSKLGDYHRDFKTLLKVNSVKLGNKASIMAVKEEKNGYMRAMSIRKKIEQFVGFEHSNGIGNFPGLGWSFFVRMPTASALSSIHHTSKVMLMGIALTAALALLFGLLFGKLAATPLQRTTSSIKDLAAGNYDIDVAYTDKYDEFGDVARAVEVFRNNAREVARLKKEQDRLTETAAQEKREMMEKLATSFEENIGHLVLNLTKEATHLKTDAQNLSEMSSVTTRQASTVAAATEEASASVQTVAAATEELSASISEINHQIGESSRIAEGAVEEIKRSNQTVSTLSTAASEIGNVSSLIQDIAEQTNLLALNATIEAARAGEAGKGFAVVASEVKNLANQTAKATEEIGQKIVTVQTISSDMVSAIHMIGSTIEKMNEITGIIANSIHQQTEAANEISHNVQQAYAGTSEVSSSIVEVTHASVESGNAAKNVLNGSQNLSEQVNSLKEQLRVFISNICNA